MPRGAREIAAGDRTADSRAGNVLVTEIHFRDHIHVEAVHGAEPPKGFDVAASSTPEPVIVPDHELLHLAPIEQDAFHELFRAQARHPPVEAEQHDVVERGLCQEFSPLRSRHQNRRSRLGIHHLERMRLEGDEDTRPARRRRPIGDLAQHRLMTQVHPIERADGDRAAARQRRQSAHGVPSTTDGLSHPSLARATAMSSSPFTNATSPSGASPASTGRP